MLLSPSLTSIGLSRTSGEVFNETLVNSFTGFTIGSVLKVGCVIRGTMVRDFETERDWAVMGDGNDTSVMGISSSSFTEDTFSRFLVLCQKRNNKADKTRFVMVTLALG